jgi:P27 family predicted phage terminase small subunit
MRGRKGQAPEVRRAKGNTRVRGAQSADPVKPVAGAVTCPAGFDDEHATKWHEVVGWLTAQGTLGAENADTVEIYVRAYVEAARARRHIAEHGPIVEAPRTGVPMHNPHRAIATSAEAVVTRLAAELGFTPTSRSRVSGQGAEAPASPWDTFAVIDGGRKTS